MELLKAKLKTGWGFYILLFLLCVFLACISKNYDYDLYARLVVGENFIEQGVFNYRDYLSYTPTHIWYDHEWGSGVVFYLFLKYFGVFGLILVQALTMFFTGVFILKTQQIQKHAYPASLVFMTLFMILFQHQNPHIVRCHMFSFMFFAMFIYFLEKTRRFNSNIIWWCLPIIIVWNNLHGGVVSGLGIIFIYMVGEILSRKPWKKYLFVFLSSIPLLAINPYGFDYFNFLLSANTKTRTYVTEWWNVFAKRHVCYYYPQFCVCIFTFLLTLVNFVNKKRIPLTKFLLLLITGYLGIVHVKLLSLPLIIIAALFYNEIIFIVNKKWLRVLEKIVCFAIMAAVLYIPVTEPTLAKTDMYKFPVKEVEFLRLNNINGNLVTEFGLGSYVAYKRYPYNLIYMDGRYEEVYYDREFDVLKEYELGSLTWNHIFTLYPTDILMPDKRIPVYKTLENDSGWTKIYEGDVCGIFVRKENVKKDYYIPSNAIRYYQITEFTREGYLGNNKKLEKDTNNVKK